MRLTRAAALALAGGTVVAAAATACMPSAASAQEPPAIGREAALALEPPELDFEPPRPDLHELPGGVEVLVLEDHALPLVTVLARFEGGYGRFPRDYFAAGLAMPSLLRSGGTASLAPDSIDLLLEHHAIQVAFGSAGGSFTSSVNTLKDQLGTTLGLWGAMLKEPGFDSARVEVWRGQELESVRRRSDDPGRLAVSEFNRLMYGDHPVGWEMSPSDLEPEDLSYERLSWLHRRILCPGNLMLGVTGDVSWEEVRPLLVRLLEGWPPCPAPLPEAPVPDIRREGGVFLIPRPLEQSTVVLAHTSDVRQGDGEDYFVSRIANSILGASGFSSRLMTRLRTQEGLAYSASSLWTTPREAQGLVGALTQTRGDATVAATRLILEVFEEMRSAPPDADAVRTAVDEAVNGFVFNFESPSQIVSRQMIYRGEGLAADWLESYLEGIQDVEPDDVLELFRRELQPERMTILVVGDPERFDEPLEALGPVTILERGPTPAPGDGATDAEARIRAGAAAARHPLPDPPAWPPSGAPRSRR